MPKGRYWNHGELRRVEEMRLAGKTEMEIAEALGRSQGSVHGILSRHRDLASRARADSIKLVALGLRLPIKDIAQRLGLKPQTIYNARCRLRKREIIKDDRRLRQ